MHPVVIPSQGELRTTQHTMLATLVLGKTSRCHAHVYVKADADFPPSPKDSLEKFALRNDRTTATESSGAGVQGGYSANEKGRLPCVQQPRDTPSQAWCTPGCQLQRMKDGTRRGYHYRTIYSTSQWEREGDNFNQRTSNDRNRGGRGARKRKTRGKINIAGSYTVAGPGKPIFSILGR